MLFVTSVTHEADNAYSIQSSWLCYRRVQFLTEAYNSKLSILVLFNFHFLWMCPFDSTVSLGVEGENVAFFWSRMFCSCLLVSC